MTTRARRQTQMVDELYRAKPSESQRLYAESVEEEGVFGDIARRGWEDSLADWRALGKQPLASRVGRIYVDPDGVSDIERMASETNARFEAAGSETRIAPARIAAEIDSKRKQLNFDFWELKNETEARRETVDARAAVYRAKELFYRGEPGDHRDAAGKFVEGFGLWNDTFQAYPKLVEDSGLLGDLLVSMLYYRESLRYSGQGDEIPPDTPLYPLWADAPPETRQQAQEQFDYEIRYAKFSG